MSSFECKVCKYTTKRKGTYDKHLLSKKHLERAEKAAEEEEEAKVALEEVTCPICDRVFKHKTSLVRHRKNCTMIMGGPSTQVDKLEEELTQCHELIRKKDRRLRQYQQEIAYFKQLLQITNAITGQYLKPDEREYEVPKVGGLAMPPPIKPYYEHPQIFLTLLEKYNDYTLPLYVSKFLYQVHQYDDDNIETDWLSNDMNLVKLARDAFVKHRKKLRINKLEGTKDLKKIRADDLKYLKDNVIYPFLNKIQDYVYDNTSAPDKNDPYCLEGTELYVEIVQLAYQLTTDDMVKKIVDRVSTLIVLP